MTIADWTLLGGVTLFAGIAQGAAGFGFGILVLPLYLLILDSVSAVQVVIIVTPVISCALVPRIWRAAPRRLLLRLTLASAAGFPLGIWLYLQASLDAMKLGVALLIVAFAVLLLFRRVAAAPRAGGSPPRFADLAVGVVAGAMASSLGMPGPPVLLYLSSQGMEKDAARSTMLTLFFFAYLGSLALQVAVVGVAARTWGVAAALLPLAALGAVGGHLLARRMSQQVFERLALLLLLGTGAYMIYAQIAA